MHRFVAVVDFIIEKYVAGEGFYIYAITALVVTMPTIFTNLPFLYTSLFIS